jgi:PH domain
VHPQAEEIATGEADDAESNSMGKTDKETGAPTQKDQQEGKEEKPPKGLLLGAAALDSWNAARGSESAKLFKRKEKSKKGWQPRFFWVWGQYAFYADKEDAELPLAIMNLRKARVTPVEPERSGYRVNKPNSFEVFVPRAVTHTTAWSDRTFVLCAETPDAAALWEKKFAKAAEVSSQLSGAARPGRDDGDDGDDGSSSEEEERSDSSDDSSTDDARKSDSASSPKLPRRKDRVRAASRKKGSSRGRKEEGDRDRDRDGDRDRDRNGEDVKRHGGGGGSKSRSSRRSHRKEGDNTDGGSSHRRERKGEKRSHGTRSGSSRHSKRREDRGQKRNANEEKKE